MNAHSFQSQKWKLWRVQDEARRVEDVGFEKIGIVEKREVQHTKSSRERREKKKYEVHTQQVFSKWKVYESEIVDDSCLVDGEWSARGLN